MWLCSDQPNKVFQASGIDLERYPETHPPKCALADSRVEVRGRGLFIGSKRRFQQTWQCGCDQPHLSIEKRSVIELQGLVTHGISEAPRHS